MMFQILFFELKYRIQRPATYVYFGILFLIGFAFIASPDINVDAGDQVNTNSPYIISQLISVLLVFSTVIIAGVMGVPVYRDFNYKFNEIIFSLPVQKWQYLGGRFLGSYIIAVLIHLGIIFGMMLGTLMPWLESDTLGPFILATYLNPLFTMMLPNLFILGMLFFSIGSLFRTQIAIYTQGVILLVIFFAVDMIGNEFDSNPINSLLEPFGMAATEYLTKYWTTFEKNTLQIPFSGYLLLNRILWSFISLIVGFITLKIFRPTPFAFLNKSKRVVSDEQSGSLLLKSQEVIINLNLKTRIYQWWYYSRFHALRIMKAVPFIILLFCSVGMVLISLFSMNMMGTPQLPVTYMLLDFLSRITIVFIIIIISIYSGELIWKDIDTGYASFLDSFPLSNRWLVFSKFTAMVWVELFVLAFLMTAGMVIQAVNGFFHFQLDVYFKVLFLNTFPYLVIITFLIFLIHTLISNKFIGHAIVVAFYLIIMFSDRIGLSHVLTRYGESITKPYSDMNGFTHFVFPSLVIRAYWFALGVVFICLSVLLIKRGHELKLKQRFSNMRYSWKNGYERIIIPVSLLVFVSLGAYIYYNTNILNTYRTKKQERAFKAEYENKYNRFLHAPEPRIKQVDLTVDLYPDDIRFDIDGSYKLYNKNSCELDTLLVSIIPWVELKELSFSHPVEVIDSSGDHGFYIYALLEPLETGDSLHMHFKYSIADKGFHHWGHSNDIVGNGSFINMKYMPAFGYNEAGELRDKKERKKAGLPEKIFESPAITDSIFYSNTYISQNADRIQYNAVISTKKDQIAISCGKLVDEWIDNDRRYFRYTAFEPQWNFYPFLSASYEVYRENYKDIDIAIYYHEGHDYNLETMVKGIKKTVDYCSKNFSPFQHDEIRIVEFPRYAMFAQSYAGTIPFSEGLGFIMDVDEKRDIDVPFFVTAHEVAHQWWGHQVCSAPVQGNTLMVESLAEYTALMVMMEEYGEEQAQKFLKYELDKYMMGRSIERKKESPLYLVDNQNYLAYQKGCLAFYNLQDFVSEDTINAALSQFIDVYGNQDAPYPTSLDFLSIVSEYVPDSLDYVIEDWFKKITLYGNRTDSVHYKELENGKYLVSLHTTTNKFQSDSLGRQQKMDLNDWLDIGVYTKTDTKKDSLIYLKKVLITNNENSFEIVVDQKPSKAGIDPINKQVDRNLLDNVKKAVAM